MIHTELSYQDRCRELTMRIERIVHLDVIGDEPSTDLVEWLVDEAVQIVAAQLDVEADQVDEELVEEEWWRLCGWVVQAAIPARDRWPAFSWGNYLTQVFHGETYEEAFEAAVAWVESLREARAAEGGFVMAGALDDEQRCGDSPSFYSGTSKAEVPMPMLRPRR